MLRIKRIFRTRLFFACCFLAAAALPFGCGLISSLGKNPGKDDTSRYAHQPNYVNGQFQNLKYADDTLQAKPVNPIRMLFSRPDSAKPSRSIPWVKTDLKGLSDDKPVVVWFGHSSVLIKHRGINILIDPIFSSHAGPLPGMVSAFEGTSHYAIEDMPAIDILIISHDHYDHLDYPTVKQLQKKVKKAVVPLGVGSHLRYWGYRPEQITELNWHQSYAIAGETSITATPARHRSNRTFAADKTLWASYVIKMGKYCIFYSGDGGYGEHFKNIGTQYGPFDLALMECGQYGDSWPHSHMYPPQCAQAASDLGAKMVLPVHWAKFAESDHKWNDPIRRLLPAAETAGFKVTVPRIGEPFVVSDEPFKHIWWELR